MYAESLENEWPRVWTVYLIKGGRGKVKIPRRQFSHFPHIFKTQNGGKDGDYGLHFEATQFK